MKISVIIPSYKPGAYIWECLGSLDAQTFSHDDFEIILVLNGCKEPYESQIQDYMAAHPQLPLRLIQTNQGGVSNARNMGLDAAQGDYIAFIDDDDYVSPSYLEELYAKAAPDTVSICYPYAFDDGNAQVQRPYSMTDNYMRCAHLGKQPFLNARKYLSGPCMKLIHKDCIGNRRFDLRFRNGEDSLFIFLISDCFHCVDFTSPQAIYYRRYRVNSAATRKRSFWNHVVTGLACMREFTKIFLQGRYSVYFYATRMAASVKNMILALG